MSQDVNDADIGDNARCHSWCQLRDKVERRFFKISIKVSAVPMHLSFTISMTPLPVQKKIYVCFKVCKSLYIFRKIVCSLLYIKTKYNIIRLRTECYVESAIVFRQP